jgi:plastocyanin
MLRFSCILAAVVALAAAPVLAGTTVVKVGHNRLEPAEVTVAVGSTVTFHNEDEMPGGHTLVAADGSFESPPLAKDEEWSHTFEKAGTYTYTIKQHPTAKGSITVK